MTGQDTAGLDRTVQVLEAIGNAWDARAAGDQDGSVAALDGAHWTCGGELVAVLWAVALGELPGPDDPVWPDLVELYRRQLARAQGHRVRGPDPALALGGGPA